MRRLTYFVRALLAAALLLPLGLIPLVGCRAGQRASAANPSPSTNPAPATTPAPAAPLPATKVNPIDGAEMVLIPAGTFLMGTSEADLTAWLKAHPDDKRERLAVELPQHTVDLDGFYMYKTEVTAAQYRKFCEATKRDVPPEPAWEWKDAHPIVNVTWEDAKAYADWAGAALPTEAQWEKAARGGDGRLYPWGNAWPPPAKAGNFADIAGYDDGHAYTGPVGSFTVNPYGIYDLAGNVWEWCADWYGADSYKNAPAKNPTGADTGTGRALRGASWYNGAPSGLRVSYRHNKDPMGRNGSIGFRCVVRSPGP